MSIKRHEPVSRQKSLLWHIKCATYLVQSARIDVLLAKAGFKPDQRREPAGSPLGGRWTDEGADLILVGHDYNPTELPEIPEERPPTVRQRNSIALKVAIIIYRVNMGNTLINFAQWLREHAEDRIVAYLDKPTFLDELQRAANEPKAGYEIHHIVEQRPARRDGFSEELIEGWRNKVRIPTYRHWQITQWYATPQDSLGGQIPREYLKGLTWQQRYEYGLEIMRRLEVLK